MPWSKGIVKETIEGIEIDYQWTEQWEVTVYKWGLAGIGSSVYTAAANLFVKRIAQLEEIITASDFNMEFIK